MKRLRQYINMHINQHKKHKRTMSVITAFSGIAVFLLVYTLILPALALEEEAYCGLEVHQHSDKCYEQKILSCGKEAHIHSKTCYIKPDISDQSGKSVEADASGTSEQPISGQEVKTAESSDLKEEAVFDVTSEPIEADDDIEKAESDKSIEDTETKADSDFLEDEKWIESDEGNVLYYKGKDYSVTVSYGEKAGLPEDVRLEVRELTEDTTDKEEKEAYENYYAQTQEAVYREENAGVAHARFFDITFVSGQEDIEPAAPVSVKIEYQNAEKTEQNAEVTAIHFPETEETELLEVEVTEEKSRVKEIAFTADSFSVYGIVYTVDFHYEIDGEEYEFSIPGGSYVSLKDVVNTLGIMKDDAATEMDEVQAFVDVVENVEFSSPELVSVSKVEEDTTVGAIKNALGLECEYSAELTEEEIVQINAAEVNAGDWALISLKPFTSEESLTVTMKNGDVVTVKVTDAVTANTSVTVKYIGMGQIGTDSLKINDGQTLIGGSSGMKPLNFRTEYIVTANTWKSFPSTGQQFVAYIVNQDSADYTNDDFKETIYANSLWTKNVKWGFSQNTTLTAVFKPSNSSFIYYKTDGNGTITGANQIGDIYYNYSTDVTGAGVRPNSGYLFDYWEYNGEKYSESTFDPSIVNFNSIVTAHFMQPYKVTYQVNNHDWGTINRRSGGVDYDWTGNSYYTDASGYLSNSVSAKANEGYEFSHWEINGERINLPYNFTAGELAYTEDSELKAFFKPVGSWKLTYVAENGGTVNSTEDFATTDTYNAAGVTATANTGYIFTGWYIGEKLFSESATLTSADLTADKFSSDDTVLTAKFRTAEQYTIIYAVDQGRVKINGKSYDDNRGVGGSDSEQVFEGEIPSGAYANNTAGGTFKGWLRYSDKVIVTTVPTLMINSAATHDERYVAKYNNAEYSIYMAVDDIAHGHIIRQNEYYEDTIQPKYVTDGIMNLHVTYTATPLAGYEFDHWELDGVILPLSAAINSLGVPDNTKSIQVLKAVFRPTNSIKIFYSTEGSGTVSNTTDFAGSKSATGSTATPGAGEHFLGWYFTDGNLALSTETITAEDLIGWKNEGKIHEGDTLTARFGAGYTITYQKQINDETPTPISSELVTSSAPNGSTAETLPGYNFLGWYKDDVLVTTNPTLTDALIGTVTSHMTFTARYSTTRVATYEVQHLDAAKDGVSIYGQVIVNGETTTSSATQNANTENTLTGGATAIPARGCDFIKWEVTDESGTLNDDQVLSKYGFDPASTVIPSGLSIPSNVTFKAQFKKQSGAMEVIYTIQEDEDPSSHAAKLTVSGRTVEGYGSTTAYISEVVPVGQAALGCSAEGTEYDNQQYKIRGWVLGDDNDPRYNKDTLFTRTSTFVPVGEYLEDIDNTGVRYFRVVTKKEKNIYIIFRVNITGAGHFKHGSSDTTNREDVLVYINSEGLNPLKSYDAVFNSESSGQAVNYYGVFANPGYKLIGFTFNGVDLNLASAVEPGGKKVARGNYSVLDPETNEYVDLTYYMDTHSKLYLPSSDTQVNEDEHVNILIARFGIEGYNIEYHVKDGLGGTVSNDADAYTSLEKEDGKKADGSVLIKGSTAIADTGADYVFVRWENENGETVSTNPQYTPKVSEITDSTKTYHFYAVFEKRPKLTVLYEPEKADYGMTIPGEETVHQGVAANGSMATAYEGYVFTHWTREGSDDIISTNPNFVPNIYGVSDEDTDHVTEADFIAGVPVKFIAHFRTEIDSRIVVSKAVNVSEGLDENSVDTVIYLALTRNGEDVLDRNGNLLVKAITVENGKALNEAVFEGMPYNDLSNDADKYEIWEMHKVGSTYERQYIGMLIGDDYQLTSIGTQNNSAVTSKDNGGTFTSGSGNNAILTETHKEATVMITNTYSKETDTVPFEVIKEWQDSDGKVLSSEDIPAGARVELTVYSENAGVTRAVRSIWLDGETDGNGEETAWKATFSNLPKYAGDGKTELTYKVRETRTWEGYKPYINGGNTYLSENLYLYNSGGKIVNKEEKKDTVLITVKKVDKADETVLLAGATFYLSKKNESGTPVLYDDGTHDDGTYTVGGMGDGLGLFSVALPDGEYQLQEQIAPSGYVIMTGAFDFKVENGVLSGEDDEYISFDSDALIITVRNESGVELPATGGSGTKLFYTLGAILTAFAGIILMMRNKKTI